MRFTSLKRWQQMGSGLQNSPVELIKKKKKGNNNKRTKRMSFGSS